MRTIAIGDIHGCFKALQSLLETIAPTHSDHLIFLGDYVDRGPDSKGVLDLLIELRKQCRTTFLLGNHEIMFRGALGGLAPEFWLQSGGSQTITSYGGTLDLVPSDHREFLNTLQPHFETETHIFVHANYHDHLTLAEQPEDTLFWEHLTDRFPGPHYSGKHVICGHTPQPGGGVGFYGYLTCLDTCCFGGYWLSAMDLESGEVWQFSSRGHIREQWKLLKRIRRLIRYWR